MNTQQTIQKLADKIRKDISIDIHHRSLQHDVMLQIYELNIIEHMSRIMGIRKKVIDIGNASDYPDITGFAKGGYITLTKGRTIALDLDDESKYWYIHSRQENDDGHDNEWCLEYRWSRCASIYERMVEGGPEAQQNAEEQADIMAYEIATELYGMLEYMEQHQTYIDFIK